MLLSEAIKTEVGAIRMSSPLLDLGNKRIFINNLIFCFQLIKESEGLLRAAIDNSSGILRAYFQKHLAEETGHADWLIEDLKNEVIDVCQIPIHFLAQEITDYQYHLIKKDAVNLLGYMAVLEGFPMPFENVALLERLHGKNLLRTLKLHSEEDIEHGQEIWEIIDKVNEPKILENAICTAYDCREIARYLEDVNVYNPSP